MKKDTRLRPREKTKPRPKQKSEARRKSKPKRKPKPNSAILFAPDKQPQFGREFCFLCGVVLDPERDTDEHVIPRWIQERYELWTERLTLLNHTTLNHTTIPYRQLTIPCCVTCNNHHLGKIEMQVQQRVTQDVRLCSLFHHLHYSYGQARSSTGCFTENIC